MSVLFAILLGLVQGLTEFLPVSSDGHLVVAQQLFAPLFGSTPPPLAFDVFLHFATLLVTVFFFRHDVIALCQACVRFGEEQRASRRLIGRLILGSIPAAAFGLGFKHQIEGTYTSVTAAGNGFIVTALFLELAHRRQLAMGKQAAVGWRLPSCYQALLIGVFQAAAVLPGVSRSGLTISSALLLGLPVETAIKFSFLLMMPAVFGANLLEMGSLLSLAPQDYLPYAAGFVATLLIGFFALVGLTKAVQGAKLRYFALYTLVLGLVLLLTR